MGYTHYWTHHRRFTNAQWAEVVTDLGRICAATVQAGISLGDFTGERRIDALSVTEWDGKPVAGFNGIDESAHETFVIHQNRRPLDEWQSADRRGWDFCKTARKPYDVAVTAALCYLESCYEGALTASSDGDMADWQAGLALARATLPEKGNMLAIPLEIRYESQFDWQAPNLYGKTYSLRKRINGDFVILRNGRMGKPLRVVPPEQVPTFVAKLEKRCATLPTSGYLSDMEAKRDRVIRDVMAYPEVFAGEHAPDLI